MKITVLFVSILFFLPTVCLAQCYRVKQVKNKFKELNVHFLNNKEFNKSRDLVFNSVDKNFFKSDTLIFIESFTDAIPNYQCCIYSSIDGKFKSFYVNREYLPYRIIREVVATDNREISRYIVDSFKNGGFDSMLRLGDKERTTPNVMLIITVLVKSNNRYTLNVWKTNNFKM